MDYVPNSDAQLQSMVEASGFRTFEELIASVPQDLRFPELKLPKPLTELELQREMKRLASRNTSSEQALSFLGAGAYEHFIPTVVDYLSGRGEFYTAYTPYQAEASQGTLQVIYEYQTLMCRLTGLDVSNASLYDGASGVAEAAFMCLNLDPDRGKIIVSAGVHPEYLQTIRTYARGINVRIEVLPLADGATRPEDLAAGVDTATAAVFVQSPNFFGVIEDMESLGDVIHGKGAQFVAIPNPISLGLLRAPGEYGADIAVGEGQPLGMPVSYGGPYLGFFTCTKALVHKIPGRLVGRTRDTCGDLGYCLTLQAREQHIRREKATSNICTNQSLMALRATIYLSMLGPRGLHEIAAQNVALSHYAAEQIARVEGCRLPLTRPFFNEFVVKTPVPARVLCEELAEQGIFAGVPLSRFDPARTDEMLVCVTETKTREDIDSYVAALREVARRVEEGVKG
ncbi:MAG: aminomethyl-transferring glycine dehydrogenase subunit GcvPA [Verrucomicrobiae bacterium]|nr:aminomethyl-transferring glycine dehydrogenase subunit GcvPA [Verrucomicrobiae bacterium]